MDDYEGGGGGNTFPPISIRGNKRLRRRKPGDMGQLTTILWGVLHDVETLFQTQAEPEIKLKAAHTLTGLSGVYIKALETHTLEKRVNELEENVRELAEKNRVAASPSQKPSGKPLN